MEVQCNLRLAAAHPLVTLGSGVSLCEHGPPHSDNDGTYS